VQPNSNFYDEKNQRQVNELCWVNVTGEWKYAKRRLTQTGEQKKYLS